MTDLQELSPLAPLTQTLVEKPPGTINMLAKVLVDMTQRLEIITASISTDIRGVAEDNKKSLSEMQELARSMEFMNATFEQLRTDVQNVCLELSEVKQQQAEAKEETRQLQHDVKEWRQEIIDLKQYSRHNNLEIKGIPPSEEESLPDLKQQVAASLEVKLGTNDIDVIHHVPSKNKERPNIVVKFTTRAARDRILQKAKKSRISTSTLGFQVNEPVYINEHLCIENKILLAKAIQTKKKRTESLPGFRKAKFSSARQKKFVPSR